MSSFICICERIVHFYRGKNSMSGTASSESMGERDGSRVFLPFWFA